MSTPLERAEQLAPADRAAAGLTATERDMLRYALELAQQTHSRVGEFTDDDQAAVAMLRRMADEAPSAPADICQFHTPAGDPCAADGCGHAAGADCHPKES